MKSHLPYLATLMWLSGTFLSGLTGQPQSALGQQPNCDVKPDVVYGHKDGLALTYDVLTPKENARGVGLLFMVSGGWVSAWAPPEQTSQFVKPLLEAGYTVFAVRHGSSPRYVIPEIATDIKQALQHIHEHADEFGVDPKRLGVFGFSAGGHLSLLLGTQTNHVAAADNRSPRIAAVVAVFPPTDLKPYVEPNNPLREQFPALKFEPSRADEFSPLAHVTADDAPTLLVHGDKDELVPIWHSEKIVDAFAAAKVSHELITIQGAAHGFNADGNKRMYEGMTRWFDQHLAP
jgi:acetyl esterase/lipase